MNPTTTSLHPSDLLHCPHCRQWHPLTHNPAAEHEYVRAMLYFTCTKGQYFAGTIGAAARYPTKRESERDLMAGFGEEAADD